jgi:hypothetical protein
VVCEETGDRTGSTAGNRLFVRYIGGGSPFPLLAGDPVLISENNVKLVPFFVVPAFSCVSTGADRGDVLLALDARAFIADFNAGDCLLENRESDLVFDDNMSAKGSRNGCTLMSLANALLVAAVAVLAAAASLIGAGVRSQNPKGVRVRS